MDYYKFASRIAGAAAATMVLNNAHNTGVRTASENVKIKSANRLTNSYMKSRRLEDRNYTTSKLKDKIYRESLDWKFPDKVNACKGYFSGAFDQLTSDIVPAVLAIGAIFSKRIPKLFGLGIVLYSIKYLFCDVLDVGRKNPLDKK